ncbi:MAG: RidA family protein [Pseudomonadota bacterium]
MGYALNPTGVWQPRGRGFSMGLVQHAGVPVQFTGQVAWDAEENIVGKGDITRQTQQCFENIKRVLAETGGELRDIVAITTYFTDRSQLFAIQEVRTQYLDFEHPPVSTSVMVAGLGHEDFLVELTPMAVIPEARFRRP